MNPIRSTVVFAATIALILLTTSRVFCDTEEDIKNVFEELISADHWRKAKAAAERLGEFGNDALPVILEGTKHEQRMTRVYCYELLLSKFPNDPQSVRAIIAGLEDKESSISYTCAFHLGVCKGESVKKALKDCIQDETRGSKTRYAAAKSLAELGDQSVFGMLCTGLGSDDHFTRYLSNIGIKALCGKDLMDFGYESPWEGAPVSGPKVILIKGHPIEKAKRKAERWNAIVSFLEWLQDEKPVLFGELNQLW